MSDNPYIDSLFAGNYWWPEGYKKKLAEQLVLEEKERLGRGPQPLLGGSPIAPMKVVNPHVIKEQKYYEPDYSKVLNPQP